MQPIIDHLEVFTSQNADDLERVVCETADSCAKGEWHEGAILIYEHWLEKYPQNEVKIVQVLRVIFRFVLSLIFLNF